ncbi:MAG TPA: hypothetical protein VE078_09035 [Thermoanaerobaculia bacterium]|nr:hypothetical protein [Thermoanaerobaculia bacterium]
MSYAGNPSLSSDVQKRVLSTFEQTLGLAAEGSRQEALLGCDFVLRMDPQFDPARQLLERLRNSAGAVRVDDLAASPPPAAGGPAKSDLRARFQELLNGRRLQDLVRLAMEQGSAVAADPELMRMASEAQERLEAEPYINKFLTSAREAARQGRHDEVARAIEKIRALDASHPGIAELQGAAIPAVPAAPVPIPAIAEEEVFGPPPVAAVEDMGFELSLDEPADLGFGTDLPELSFDEPARMDPELVTAADFVTSMQSGDSESDRRIRQLLDEGQSAYQAGDLQSAIDAWSRIFLIDIDHQEAARRIEQARKVKAEGERQAEEVFHEGMAQIEAGDLAAAKQSFQRVLETQPGNFAAREYLQQLEAGTVPTVRPTARHETAAQPAMPVPTESDLDLATGELKEEILIPPDPSEVAAAERQRPKLKPIAPAKEGKARKTFVLVGSIVLVLALAGGAFVYLNKERLFPNSQAEEPAASDSIARATELHSKGQTDKAIRQLSLVSPEDPSFTQAQQLIAQWRTEAPVSPAAPAVPTAAPPPPAVSPERLALLGAARAAYDGGQYLEAIERLEEAQEKGQLEAAEAELLAGAKRQVEPIAAQVHLFEQHEWEPALRDLWRLREKDPGNRDITRLMVDSYYNLGLRDLQRMDTARAVANFREGLGLGPEDKELQRQLAFAQTYQERPKDMLYRIYVKHLALR